MNSHQLVLYTILTNPPEVGFYKELNGCKFRRQHPFNRYILDFYCHENKLAIEVDGDVHRDKCDQNEFRDKYLESVGIKTIRIKNDEILHRIDEVLIKIMASL